MVSQCLRLTETGLYITTLNLSLDKPMKSNDRSFVSEDEGRCESGMTPVLSHMKTIGSELVVVY